MLRKPPVQQALSDLGGAIVRLEGPDGIELFDVPGGPIPPARTKAPPRLLGMWDNVLLAYADRSRVLPDAYRPHVIRRNGDVLPTVLVDGRVAGVWRSCGDAIEVSAFHELSTATWRALTTEAQGLAALLAARDSRVYRRYDHWWDELPVQDRPPPRRPLRLVVGELGSRHVPPDLGEVAARQRRVGAPATPSDDRAADRRRRCRPARPCRRTGRTSLAMSAVRNPAS